jgi:citrate synthase
VSEYVKGLEGVVAAQTEISLVDGQAGRLLYRGYEISEIARSRTFEEVAYLLWFGDFPSPEELQQLTSKMIERRDLTESARVTVEAMRPETDPIDALRTVISAQAASDRLIAPDMDQAIEAAAAIPTVLTSFYRRRQGLEPVPPRSDLGHAENYLYMLTGEEPSEKQVEALNAYLIMLADHGMNASTFTCRVIASTGSDLASCLVGGVGALKGPLHGGAPSYVMEQIQDVRRRDDIEQWALEVLERRERFMGFGHPVYRTYDPRARILREMCEELNPDFFETASRVEEVVLRLLNERYPNRPMATNVEFYSAGVLEFIALPIELFTPTFATARAVGWSAHVLEQVEQQRTGASKIIRPQSEYIGPLRTDLAAATGNH